MELTDRQHVERKDSEKRGGVVTFLSIQMPHCNPPSWALPLSCRIQQLVFPHDLMLIYMNVG